MTIGRRNVYQINDLVRVIFSQVSNDYRWIRKDKLYESKLVIHYSPTISRVTQVYPPNNNTRFVQMYSIAVGGPDGLPPGPNVQTLRAGGFPILYTGNQLVLAGNRASIVPRDEQRANRSTKS